MVVYLLLGSSAFALFLPQVKLTGLQMRTANLALLVGVRGGDNPIYSTTETMNGAVTLQPGMDYYAEQFWVKNDSSITQQVDLSMRIEGGSGDWDELEDLVQIELYDPETTTSTGWFTLAEWQAERKAFPNPHLVETQARKFEIHYEFADTYPEDPDGEGPLQAGDPIGNELMDKAITGLELVIEGTPTTL